MALEFLPILSLSNLTQIPLGCPISFLLLAICLIVPITSLHKPSLTSRFVISVSSECNIVLFFVGDNPFLADP